MKRLFALVAVGLLSLVAFGFGFSLRDVWSGQMPNPDALKRLIGQAGSPTPAQTYQKNFDVIENRYDRKIPSKDLRYAAMTGLVETLGDPHTDYFEPVAADRFSTETRGDFVGVGARLGENALGAKVVAVFEDGPASKAGLKVNDVITVVDGEKVAGTPVNDIVSKIRGERGTTVVLGVVRPGASGLVTMSIVRAKVEIPTSEAKILAGNMGYVTITQFASSTPDQFDRAMDKVMAAKVKGLVIDLRDDPGGLLESASQMIGRFVSNKTVVKMRLKGGEVQEVKTPEGKVIDFPKPIVLLVNENSASAAEIFSGCMRDYHLATLVGDHTYGKTSVQNVHTIPIDGASVKVTIAKYFLPSGTNFDRKVDEDGTYLSGGLKPDVAFAEPENEQVVIGDPEKDPQLKKALDVISSSKP